MTTQTKDTDIEQKPLTTPLGDAKYPTQPLLCIKPPNTNNSDNDDNDNDNDNDDNDDEPVEIYASPQQLATLRTNTIMKSALKMSGFALLFAFVSVYLIWYRFVFELASTSTWQTVVFLFIALVQSSIFANTVIVIASVIHGKFGGQLHTSISPNASNKECRGNLLFLDALCQGSYKATLGVVVAMVVMSYYHYTKAPFVFDLITLCTLAVFFVSNIISAAVIKAASTKVKAALMIVKKEVYATED